MSRQSCLTPLTRDCGCAAWNPAISDERPGRVDRNLDPFAAKNGFNLAGASQYSESFKKNYFAAQLARMNHLIDVAMRQLRRIEAGKDTYSDDAPFNIPGFENARLLSLDPSIRHTTVQPEKLLKNDGTVVTQVVESIAPPRPELAKLNRTFGEGARGSLTIRSFLGSNAIRSTNSMDEKQTDLCSSNNSTPCMLQSISVPLLAVAHQASFRNLIPGGGNELSELKERRQGFHRRRRFDDQHRRLHQLRKTRVGICQR